MRILKRLLLMFGLVPSGSLLTGPQLQERLLEMAAPELAKLQAAITEAELAKADYARKVVELTFAEAALEREKLEYREYVNLGAVHVKTHVDLWRARN